jgi:hypothetical protein
LLRLQEVVDQGRPLDAGLDIHDPALGVEVQDAVKAARVDENTIGDELLSAHGVAPAGDANAASFRMRGQDRSSESVKRRRGFDAAYPGGIQLGVDVVDQSGAALRLRGPCRR